MVVSLEKYGVTPKSVYPESISSSDSRELNQTSQTPASRCADFARISSGRGRIG